MTIPEDDLQRQRAAGNRALFREVNERIDELGTRLRVNGGLTQYVCECIDGSCTDMIAISHHEYRRIRQDPSEFIVVPGHESPPTEEVVHRDTRWLIVKKVD